MPSFCLFRAEYDSPSVDGKGVFAPERGAASCTITLALSRAWVWPGLLWGFTILRCTLGIKTASPLLEQAPQPSSSLSACLPALLPVQGVASLALGAQSPPQYPLSSIHRPVHFCFQCNVPPQALPPPLLPRLHQSTPYRLNARGAPTAAIPCGSEL